MPKSIRFHSFEGFNPLFLINFQESEIQTQGEIKIHDFQLMFITWSVEVNERIDIIFNQFVGNFVIFNEAFFDLINLIRSEFMVV